MRLQQVRSLALLSELRSGIAESCGVGCRCGSELALLWLWCRPVATAPIRPLAWEPPYAEGVALEKDKKTHAHMHVHVCYWVCQKQLKQYT